MYSVYIVTNNINKMRYVGITSKTIDIRFTRHCLQGNYLTSAIKKYNKHNFSVELITKCSSKKLACLYEIKLIKQLSTKAPNGYNFSDGGECPTHTLEVRQKISKTRTGKKCTESHRLAIKKAAKERSAKLKGIARPNFTDEWKLNISKGKKGTTHTQEHKDNISNALRNSEKAKNADKGKHFKLNNPSHNPIVKELVARKKWKAIYCESLDICFLSLKHAAEYLGVVSNRISTAMFRGSKINGLTFSYIQK